MSHDDQDQAGASAGASTHSVLVSPLVLRGKRRRGVPRRQVEVSPSVQRDQDQQDGKKEVTMEPKAASPPEPFAGEDRFCRDKLY